MAGTLRFDLWR